MPDLSTGQFHRDVFLENLLVGYAPSGFIAEMIAPVVPVDKQSATYPIITKADWFRVPNTLRAPATPAKEVRFTVSSDTYYADNHELGGVIPWETIDNASAPWRPLELQGQQIKTLLALDYEDEVATLMATAAGSSMTQTGGNAWSDTLNSDPLADIDVAGEAIRSTTGTGYNTMVMGYRTWLALRRHPVMIRAAYPGAGVGGVVDIPKAQDLFGVDRILIGRAIKNTAADDTVGTTTFTDVWSTNVYLMQVAPNPGIMVPTALIGFNWNGPNIGGGSPGNPTLLRRTNTKIKAEEIQYGYYRDVKVVSPELIFRVATGIT